MTEGNVVVSGGSYVAEGRNTYKRREKSTDRQRGQAINADQLQGLRPALQLRRLE